MLKDQPKLLEQCTTTSSKRTKFSTTKDYLLSSNLETLLWILERDTLTQIFHLKGQKAIKRKMKGKGIAMSS